MPSLEKSTEILTGGRGGSLPKVSGWRVPLSYLDIGERSQKAVRWRPSGSYYCSLALKYLTHLSVPWSPPVFLTSKILGTAGITNFLLYYAKIF